MKFAKSFGAAFALVLLGFIAAQATNSYFWGGGSANGPGTGPAAGNPSTNGPWLGDWIYNINTLYVAHARDAGMAYAPSLSVSQVAGQSSCTQFANDAFVEVKTSAATGYVCLPPAISGKRVTIGNASGSTLTIYSALNGFVAGTVDTVNGSAGTSGYNVLPGVHLTMCIAANNGAWYCGQSN